ncbi:MAG: circadian clock protein KaiC [Candidatus Magnetomorum sp.]|nr:circadian clock protein KaiC [Candidatus Magnetomorum sp.]
MENKYATIDKGTLPKIPTRIAGLDDILQGGIPEHRTTIISGGPGCGKSIFGIEFLYMGAKEGHPGIYVTFEERADAVRQNAMTMGWNLAELEKQNLMFIMEANLDPKTLISGDFSIQGLFTIIEGKAKAMNCTRIVIDAVDILLRMYNDFSRERSEYYVLHDWFSSRKMTSIMSVKSSQDHSLTKRYEFLDFMADCVIHLDQRVRDQISTRRIRVTKYRGSNFGRNEYPYVISDKGLNIVPISTTGLRHRPLGDPVSSGNIRLDSILGGGYRRASCVLIAGITGAGKTTLANTFIHSVCSADERVLYIGFEESEEAIVTNMLSPGIDLRPAIQSKKLRFLTSLPEAMGAEEHLMRAIDQIKSFKPAHIILDAVSACDRMGSTQTAFEYLIRLLNYCKENDITCILLNQTVRAMDIHQISGMEISSMVDTALFLGMVEVGGEINRMLLVLKSRGLAHSNQYREYLITDNGIELLDVYIGEGGVLTGAARQEQEAKESANQRLRENHIILKKHELTHKEAAKQAKIAALQAEIDIFKSELDALMEEENIWHQGRNIRSQLRGKAKDDALHKLILGND